jgi:hypothetical protein
MPMTPAGGGAGPVLVTRVGGVRTRRVRIPFPPPTRPAQPARPPRTAPAGERPVTAAPGGKPSHEPWHDRLHALLRRHWLVCLLAAAGLLLRAASELAYRPALIYVDTLKYLYGSSPGADPLGYRAILLAVGNLSVIALLQHLLGIAVAFLIYAVVLRRGAGRWLAALAAAPVLLDAYQLQMEQTVMPDVWFDAMVVVGLAVLLWRPALTAPFVIAAGLILGASAAVRAVGEILIVPTLIYVLAAAGGWRRAAEMAAVMSAAFALPVLGYCTVSSATTGHFWLARQQSTSGRLAAAADCATLRLPAAVRPLCPSPSEQAHGPDWLEHTAQSPLHAAPIPAGANRAALIGVLDSAVEHQQPARVAAAIARDSVRLFALTRDPAESVTPISRWQFQTRYPTYPPWVRLGHGNVIVAGVQKRAFTPFRFRALSPAYGGRAQVDRPAAALLRSYQLDGGYTPGPLLALFALAGVAGSALALLRRARSPRGRQLALGCLLFTATAATLLLVPDALEFSWRYQLPALVTLPPAGVLGFGAAASAWRARQESRNERVIAMSDVAWIPGPGT